MANRKLIIALSLIIAFSLSFGTSFSAEKKKAASKKKPAPPVSNTAYKIGAGDILRITTWKEVDFSLDQILVRIDGKITFPLLDDIQAAGLTPMQLKKVLERELKKYVAAPVVTVFVVSPDSKKFYILGEIARTGEFPLLKNMTVLQAFALAGGFSEWAEKDEIVVLRHEGGKDRIIRVNYKRIAKGKDLSSNIEIKADDTIIVP
jgi:polysaccharide export outer membrane protein